MLGPTFAVVDHHAYSVRGMGHTVETDINVARFSYTGDSAGQRLSFPHAEAKRVAGRVGTTSYGIEDCVFDGLEGRLDTLRWTASAASLGSAWIRDDDQRFDVSIKRIEMPHDVMLTRAESGVEIVAPQVSFSEMQLSIRGPFTRARSAVPPRAAPVVDELRQEQLRFLDSLSGRIAVTVKVVLDLPVLGKRTLDQQLRVPIQEGSLDFRALEESLDWLEGSFLEIDYESSKLALRWKVPIVGSGRDLLTWQLDEPSSTLASFGRVPVRALADYRTAGKPASRPSEGKQILRALSLEALDLALSLLAPRSLAVGDGLIMFGGDDQPGMVDLKVSGGIDDHGPGKLTGAIGSIDTTIKDLQLGPVLLTADRLHLDGLDQLVVTFEGFRPTRIDVLVRRVTATNLAMRIGRRTQHPDR
jgi:hypothetical protein